MHKFNRLAKPYEIWMYVLVVFPIVLMIGLSFLDVTGFDITRASFSFKNFTEIIHNRTYRDAFFLSMELSLLATLICFIVGYPVAYIISRSGFSNKYLILLILILPMWTNMILRLNALKYLSLPEGFFKNTFLEFTEFRQFLRPLNMNFSC